MPTAICPECSEEVYVDADSEQGDNVTCDECASKLVVVGLDPFEVDLADDEDEERHAFEDEQGLDESHY